MSEQAPDGIYVYQLFGIQDGKERWDAGRIYAIGGLPIGTEARGFTKPEAHAIHVALVKLDQDGYHVPVPLSEAGSAAQSDSAKENLLASSHPQETTPLLPDGTLSRPTLTWAHEEDAVRSDGPKLTFSAGPPLVEDGAVETLLNRLDDLAIEMDSKQHSLEFGLLCIKQRELRAQIAAVRERQELPRAHYPTLHIGRSGPIARDRTLNSTTE